MLQQFFLKVKEEKEKEKQEEQKQGQNKFEVLALNWANTMGQKNTNKSPKNVVQQQREHILSILEAILLNKNTDNEKVDYKDDLIDSINTLRIMQSSGTEDLVDAVSRLDISDLNEVEKLQQKLESLSLNDNNRKNQYKPY